MSTAGPPPVAPEALNPQVEALLRESAALSAALAQNRNARRLLLLVFLVFVVVVCFTFYRLASDFMGPGKDRVLEAAQKRFETKGNQYMVEVQHLVDHASPILTEAFYKQAKSDLPHYLQAMERQRDDFAKTLEAQLKQKLDKHYEQLLTRHQRLLKEEFPNYTDEKLQERMTANLDVAVQKLVKKFYIEEMQSQVRQLNTAWDEFPPAAAPGKDEPPLVDQFIAHLLEMLKYKLSHSQGLSLTAGFPDFKPPLAGRPRRGPAGGLVVR